jgi:hypothetical protein
LKPREEEEKEEALTKFTNLLMQISFVIISAMSIWWESLRSGICCQNVMGIRPTVFSYLFSAIWFLVIFFFFFCCFFLVICFLGFSLGGGGRGFVLAV